MVLVMCTLWCQSRAHYALLTLTRAFFSLHCCWFCISSFQLTDWKIFLQIGRFSPFLQATKALRVSKCITLPFLSPRHAMEWASSPCRGRVYPRERSGTQFTGGLVGPRTILDERKISSSLGFDPGSSNPSSVATPTELPFPVSSKYPVKIQPFFSLNDLTINAKQSQSPCRQGEVHCSEKS